MTEARNCPRSVKWLNKRMDQDGGGQAGQDIGGPFPLAPFRPALGHDPDQGDGAAMHDRRAEAADEPEQRAVAGKGIQEIEILQQGEAGADGKADDGRIDQEAQPVAAQQQEKIGDLGGFLDPWRQVAGVGCGAQPGLGKQPAVQQQAEQAGSGAGQQGIAHDAELDQPEIVEHIEDRRRTSAPAGSPGRRAA